MRAYKASVVAWHCRRAAMVVLGLSCCAAAAQNVSEQALSPSYANAEFDVMDLSRAWYSALQNDHTYRAALSEQAAVKTERSQGRAGLLPRIQASYARSKVWGSGSQAGVLGQQIGFELDYYSSSVGIQLQQPLLNYTRYAEYKRGRARTDQGDAVFAVRHQEVGVRLATAYFNTLLAYDNLALQRSLTASLQDRLGALQARYRRNEGTRTDVQETEARLAVARADVIVAGDGLVVAWRELESLLGAAPTHVAALRPEFPLPPLSPASLLEWLDLARAHSAEVQAARLAVRVADTDLERATSRYLPTIDLVATYSRASSETLSALSQRHNTFSIGVQVNIPIFTGGYNTADVARVRSERMRLQHELHAVVDKTQTEVARQYTNVSSGADHIEALRTAVASSRASLAAMRKGFELGVADNLDVLKAQDKLHQAKYELTKAHLDYLLARVKLAAAAGELRGELFDEINAVYLGRRISLADRGLQGDFQ